MSPPDDDRTDSADPVGSGAGSMPNGIRAVGTYAPRYRLSASEIEAAWGSVQSSGVGRKAVPDAGEDALTMAYEAARNALRADGTDGSGVDRLAFATTNPPVEEADLTARLGSMLGVPESADMDQFGGSTRAGTRALAAVCGGRLDRDEVGLVVAADCPKGEPGDAEDQAAGAAAAAFVVVPNGPASVVARGTHTEPYPGTRFRERGSERTQGLGVTSYDRRAFRETIAGAVDSMHSPPWGAAGDVSEEDSAERDAGLVEDVDAAAIQAPNGSLPYRVADAIGVGTEAIERVATVHELGDTGAASALVGLARALDDPDVERTLVVGYGSGGGADAFVVDAEDPVPSTVAIDRDDTADVSYAAYLRLRDEITSGAPAGGGAYVSVPSWRRTLPQRHRLVAGRCVSCDALSFPPEGACLECGERDGYVDVTLPGTGAVEAATAISQGGAPPEFAVQQQRAGDYGVVVVAFDGPAGDDTVSAPAQVCDVDADAVEVGDRVAATMRRIYTQEGVIRYGFKVRPLEDG